MVLLLMKLDQLDQEIENALSASSSMDTTPILRRRQLLVHVYHAGFDWYFLCILNYSFYMMHSIGLKKNLNSLNVSFTHPLIGHQRALWLLVACKRHVKLQIQFSFIHFHSVTLPTVTALHATMFLIMLDKIYKSTLFSSIIQSLHYPIIISVYYLCRRWI